MRPTQGASGGVGGHTMESDNWRAQLQRQRVVNKIIDTLERHLPFSGYNTLQELKKIAERVEEETYTTATSQSEYSRKTCFMMLTMETRLKSPMSDPIHSNSAANSVNPLADHIKVMKELYLLDWRAQLQADIRSRIVNQMMVSLKQHIPFSGHEGLHELKKKAERVEEEIYTIAISPSDYLWKISLKVAILSSNGV
ncbi:hypothetical protein E3N88_44976 [Mikania micrantha]|uniref:Mediator complex subunit 15 KIX domain-containing protein n=1 Tax=Mikania micrantha TaxID=192012 RepID=A0A5N6LAI0_9ASTR|nr:hypothetical protein E3N88_44976 [Mikania micrantha]